MPFYGGLKVRADIKVKRRSFKENDSPSVRTDMET